MGVIMPIIEVHLLEGYDDSAKTRLGQALTDAVRMVVPASPDTVTIMIHEMPTAHYMRGRTHRSSAAALPDPCDLVRRYLAAMEARDLDTARSMLGNGFTMTFPGGGSMTTLEQLIEWSKTRYKFVRKDYSGTEALQNGNTSVVYTRGTLSGEWLDGTPFEGIRFIDRFEVVDSRITRQDVWNDIAEIKAAK
jgi:4-oxalocrotonate tautomerase family enzyme